MDEKSIKVADRLRAVCSRREYCMSDVFRKALKALDGDETRAKEVLEVLVNEKYVDDFRYASAFARDKSSIQGWGSIKIRYMLSSKGINRDVISMALEEVDRDRADGRLLKLLETRYRTLKDDPQCRLKLLRYAMGRGYGYDEVKELIDKMMRNEDV